MPELRWSLICENAAYNEQDDLVMVGEFNKLRFNSYPSKPFTFYVVSTWDGERGETFDMRIKLISPDREMAIESEYETFTINENGARILELYPDIVFSMPSEYRFEFYIADNIFHSLPLYVLEPI